MSSLEIAHFDDFKSYRSYPSMCVDDIYQDKMGKLWLKSCGAAIQLSAHLFSFDGYNFSIVPGELSKIGNRVFIAGVVNDTLYGSNHENDNLLFFKMDLLNQKFQYFDSIPFLQNAAIAVNNGKFYSYKSQQNILKVKTWEGNKLQTKEFDLTTSFGLDSAYIEFVKIRDDHVWIWDPKSYRFCILDLINNNKSEIDVSQYFNHHDIPSSDLFLMELYFSGELLHIKFKKSNQWYFKSFQLYLNQQVSMVEKLELNSPKVIHAFSDKKSNLLYLYEDDGEIKAFIELKGNVKLDASDLFKNVRINRVKNIIGEDFLKEFYLCNEVGFSVIKVKLKNAIHKVEIPASLRSINELDDNRLLINSQSRVQYLHDFKLGEFTKLESNCVSEVPILKKRGDHYWSFGRNNFISYNPRSNECIKFPAPISALKVFDFYKNDFIIGSHDDDKIIIYNINKNSHRILKNKDLPFTFESVVHNVLVDSKERIWMVNAEGLFQVDIQANTVENITSSIEGFNFKLLSIAEGDNGELWLGSSLSGLIILDPDTKEFTHISSDQGLCNNTVASVTRDNNGMFWLGTYNGIALINENGELLTNFYEKDGLVNNESNRYSSTVLSNGNVVIGSIEGFTILNPDIILRNLYEKTPVSIYLTNASYLDDGESEPTYHTNIINATKTIELPSRSKNLTLEFAVSNYIRPLENKYAYKIDAFHDDWIELGNTNSLELRDLPSGRYKLEIRGGDNLGNWSNNNLELKIHAKQFFYKSGWFYFLLFGLISVMVLLWITSLRKQVKLATEEIIEDKEIIERQAQRLKELDEAKSDFFTNISHEFRTPLTIISGMIDQIKSKPDTWLEKGSQMIKENTLNLLNLINQILDLRKLESNSLSVHMVQGDIVSYIQYLVNSHKHLAEQDQIELSFESTQNQLIMDYDPEKILRIISNLLSNAIKFNKSGGNVNVSLSVVESSDIKNLIIKVQDTGKGISSSDLEGIFDRFYQAESETKTSIIGTGIGLSLTKQLVNLLDGSISVNSVLGSGSEFTIELPVFNNSQLKEASTRTSPLNEDVEEVMSTTNALPPSIPKTKKDGLPNLLIVEDNESIITLISAQLEDEYNITFKLDGDQGVQAAVTEVPDIIISDIMMPVKDGIQLCKELKTDERTSHIPIILLTAKSSQQSKLLGLEQRADAYLSKPFDPKELKLRMSNLLSIRDSLQGRFKNLDFKTKSTETPKEDAFVLKLRNAILENVDDESFGVMQLCRAAGLSRSQMHNKTKALTGLSTSNYIRSVRLQKAREMLQSSDMNVSEVAYAVGFNNPTYFSSSYTQEFGENPSKTRK